MKFLISTTSGLSMKMILMLLFYISFLGNSSAQELVCNINGKSLICNSTNPFGIYSIDQALIPLGGYVEWEVIPGGTITSQNNFSTNITWPTGTGNYLVTVNIYNAQDEQVDDCELEVTIENSFQILPRFETICPGETVEFTGTSDCEDCTFIWTVSNNWIEGVDYDFLSVDDHTATIVFYTSNSNGSVQYSTSNGSICAASATAQIDVIDTSEPTFNVIEGTLNGGNIELCNGQEVFFDNTTPGDFIYYWHIVENATNQEWNYFTEDISFNFLNPGQYTIDLTKYDPDFQYCFSSTTQTINVLEGIPIPIVCPSVVCEGQTITYSVEENCTGAYTWTIVQPDGTETTETGNPISVTWSLEGSSFGTGYVIFYPDGCPSNFCTSPSVQEVPIFPNEFEMDGIDFLCRQANFSVSYDLTSGSLPGATYTWGIDEISTYSGGVSGQSIPSPGFGHIYNVSFEDETDQTLFNGVIRIWVEIEHPIAGCVGYVEKMVEVIQGDVIGPHEICVGDGAVYEFIPDPGRTINWSLSLDDEEVIAPTPGGSTFTIPSSALTEPGDYEITAIVLGDQGEICKRMKDLTVLDVPPPPVIEGQTSICPGTPYLYSIADCGTQYSVEWTVNNGGVINTYPGCSIGVVWASAGPYNISAVQHIIVNGEISCSSTVTDLEINTGTPEVKILPEENPCPNSIVEYYVSPTGWTNYNWIAPANGSLVSVNGTSSMSIQWFDVEAPTSDVITVEVNHNDCVPPVTLDVVITPFELEIIADDICADDPINITSNATSADSYQWFVNNELVSTDINLNYIFPTSDFYDIRLETVNPNGCMGIFKKAITIYASSNPKPVISRAIDFCGKDGNLAGTLSVTPNSPSYSYQWFLDGNEINGANSPVLDITQTGTYTITIDYGLCQNDAFINIVCVEDECDCTIGSDFDVFQINHLDYDGTCGSIGFSGTIIDLSNAASAYWVVEGPNNYNEVIEIQSESDLTISGFQLPQRAGLYTLYLEACIPCIDSDGCCIIREEEKIVIPFIPEFDFTFNCAGEDSYNLTLLDVSSYYVSSSTVNIQWEVNGTIYNGSTITVPDLTPGTTANIKLQINSPEYPAYSCNLSEEIDLPESINGTFTFEGGLCADQAITFIPVMALEELLEWEWIFNDENSILSYSPMFSFEETGTHQVTLNLTSVYGCTSQYTEMLTVGDPLEGEIEKTMENCEAQAILGYNQTSGAPVTNYLWDPSEETTSTIEVTETGAYTVTVTNAEGCVAIASTALDLNNPFLNGINGPSEICEGETATLSLIYNPNYDFEWEILPCPDNVCTISGNSINLSSWPPDTYTITVNALQGEEICLSETTTLVVHDVPEFVIDQEVTQCEPFTVKLEIEFTDGENNGIIEWSSNEITIPEGITGTTFFVSQNGSFSATYTDNITGCTNTEFIFISADIDFSLFPTGCYDYCTEELAANPIEIPGINICDADYEWQINYGNGYEILAPPGASTIGSFACSIPSATISGLPAGETEAKIRLLVDNGICAEESEDFCIAVEECCETCTKVLNLQCEEILANGNVVFSIDGDLACLPEGYEFCGTPPIITSGGYLDIDEESVVIYEPPMFDPLYWFAGTLVVTNFDYFVANGGLEAEIDICGESGVCKAQFFIEYENEVGEADIDVSCIADPDECATDIYDISGEIPIPLGWSYCGDALMVDGGYLEVNSISNTCDRISFSGRLFVTDPTYYQSNQGLELNINICQDGEVQVVNAQIPYKSCDGVWPYPYQLSIDCIENQNFVELCIFTPYFTTCNPCEEQPLELLVIASNPPITIYNGPLVTDDGDYACFEAVIPDDGDDLTCINFLITNDCYGSPWSICTGSNCSDNGGLGSIEGRQHSGKQHLSTSFDLVPNPASDQVNVHFTIARIDSGLEGIILLQDIFGRTYAEKAVQLPRDHNVQLNLSDLSAGIYWVVLKNETGLLQSKKLVKF